MEKSAAHPSSFITRDDLKTIRDTAAKAEQLGELHPDQLAIIYRENWFKLLVPQTYGGLQIGLPYLVRLQEAISWADGSTGWVVTLCSGAGWFGGFLRAATACTIFKNPKVCFAGSGAPGGTATITQAGFVINGKWQYASGSHHATHITANCVVEKNGEPVLDDYGQPLILPFIFDKGDVQILPAWKYVGMCATGSDAFEIKNLEVTAERQFKIDAAAAVIPDALYRYPFLQLAEATLAVNLSGMAVHFMDLCDVIFDEKLKQPKLSPEKKVFLIGEIMGLRSAMNFLRKNFFEAVDDSWNVIQTSDKSPTEQLQAVSLISRQLAKFARESVDKLYPLCGLLAASTDTEINRVWRDLHTASQHSLLTFSL